MNKKMLVISIRMCAGIIVELFEMK